jgi:hypothetical protein
LIRLRLAGAPLRTSRLPRGAVRVPREDVAPSSFLVAFRHRLSEMSSFRRLSFCAPGASPREEAREDTFVVPSASYSSLPQPGLLARAFTAPPFRALAPGHIALRFFLPARSLSAPDLPNGVSPARVAAPRGFRLASWPRSLSLSDLTREPRSCGRRPHNQALQQTGTRLLLGASRRQARASS